MRYLLLLVLLVGSLPVGADDGRDSPLHVVVFYSPRCRTCRRMKEELLPKLAKAYPGQIVFDYLDADLHQNYRQLAALCQSRQEHPRVPAVLIGDRLILGSHRIKKQLPAEISNHLQKPYRKSVLEPVFAQVFLEERFRGLAWLTIMGAGLIDGVNPCAFTVIVFFMSFLALHGYQKRELIIVGSTYLSTVLLAYLLIGIGLFNFLYTLKPFYLVSRIFHLLMATLCFTLGTLSIYDYFRFRSSRRPEASILQLPKSLKQHIHGIIRKRFKAEGVAANLWQLVLGTVVVGFLVSLLEGVCTGQIYLPVISLVLNLSTLRGQALSYLLLYNLMFIIPLLIVFLFALWGTTSDRFAGFLKKMFGVVRITMAGLLFALGLLLLLG